MRVALDAGDRTLLIVAGVLLVLISFAAVLFVPQGGAGGSTSGFPSSYSAASDGAKAAYLLLGELGYRTERWSSPPSELPDPASNVVLVLADPVLPPFSEETAEIQRFVRRGGRVVVTGARGALLVKTPEIAATSMEWGEAKEFPALLPGPISRRAPQISMQSWIRSKAGQAGGVEYYGDGQGGSVVSFRRGKGRLVWWADSLPLTNYGLTQASNLELFLNSVGEPKGGRVLWDEYYHGQRSGLWTYLSRTPVPWGLVQAAVLVGAVILTYSRRSGPVSAPVKESRLSPIEFVETVGDLYARKRSAAGALEIAYRRFRSLLAKRFGLAPEASLEKIGPAIRERFGSTEPELAPVLAQCEAILGAGKDDEAAVLKLIQELHNQTHRLRLAAGGTGVSPV